MGGPVSEKFANKEISRVIEIRGDQTLEELHHAIFQAYDRWDQHMYEFQFGKASVRSRRAQLRNSRSGASEEGVRRDARTTKLDDLQSEAGTCLRVLVRFRR